jgi:hypothetical protein
MKWFKPPSASYTHQGVEVAINPELGRIIDGQPHIVKLYLKGEKLVKSRANIIPGLMELTLREKAPEGGSIRILDVRNAKAFSFAEELPAFHAMIDGELSYVASMWDRV